MNKNNKITNYLTIDVEDYFQVAAFEDIINPDDWDSMDLRVEKNTEKILDLLAAHNTHATFFITGWVADKVPDLVGKIVAAGHQIGCHSYWHRKIYDLSQEEFYEDTARAKEVLEKYSGVPITSYRAPSYSITKKSLWALDVLEQLGFTVDSSIFPIYHDTYGIPDAPRFPYQLPDHKMMEYPISTALFFGRKVPIAGGGYFRLFPYWFTRHALCKINRQEKRPFIFYFHPWEVDPEQPRMTKARRLSKFRHYNNLDKTYTRLERLLNDFVFSPVPQ